MKSDPEDLKCNNGNNPLKVLLSTHDPACVQELNRSVEEAKTTSATVQSLRAQTTLYLSTEVKGHEQRGMQVPQ